MFDCIILQNKLDDSFMAIVLFIGLSALLAPTYWQRGAIKSMFAKFN